MDTEIKNDETHENLAAEITCTWNKIVRDSKKLGFRNGAGNGQDLSFQEHFNKGYLLGFATGFQLGKFKGAMRAKQIQTNTEVTDELLTNSRRGYCSICRDNTLLQRSIEDIQMVQVTSSNALLNNLNIKHSGSLNVCLQQQLN